MAYLKMAIEARNRQGVECPSGGTQPLPPLPHRGLEGVVCSSPPQSPTTSPLRPPPSPYPHTHRGGACRSGAVGHTPGLPRSHPQNSLPIAGAR